MKVFKLSRVCLLGIGVAVALVSGGCSPSASPTAATSHNDHDHEHGEWWCAEHGVPEEECAQCDKGLVAKFKDAKDWCDKHNRPQSQCFLCDPKNFDKFAARYEAKFGEKPEMPTE